MERSEAEAGYGAYWRTWVFLLILTLVMVLVDVAAVPKAILISVLLVAMLTKATLIAGNFMHLKAERLSLRIAVAASLLLVGAVLFLLIVPDGLRILRMAP
ncbi:MAG: cytochrome C oxidase subunit IV family protein [Acidobacteriota bacterium]